MKSRIPGPLGVALLTFAVLLFAIMNATTKSLAQVYAVPAIMAVRYGVQTGLMVLLVVPRGGWQAFRSRRPWLVLLRTVSLIASSLLLGLALQRMPVAETAAIAFSAPMVVVLVARPLLGEKIGVFGWAAVASGFAGVLLIVRPGSGLDGIGLIFLALNVLAAALYQLMSRGLSQSESVMALLFQTAAVGALIFGAMAPFYLQGPPPSLLQVGLLLSLGLTGGLGHFLFTAAYGRAPASLLSPVNYLELVWAGLIGWAVFGHLPDLLSALGMTVVAASGVMAAIRSYRMGRQHDIAVTHAALPRE